MLTDSEVSWHGTGGEGLPSWVSDSSRGQAAIQEQIQVFYNRMRSHSALGRPPGDLRRKILLRNKILLR